MYSKIQIPRIITIGWGTVEKLKEVIFFCELCESIKPFHNVNENDLVFKMASEEINQYALVVFKCVSCNSALKGFSIYIDKESNSFFSVTKCGEYPQKDLPKNKVLTKFLKNDKEEYSKAIVCLANGYGVAAFAYFRRIVESNITRILDLIIETENPSEKIVQEINELRKESPMSKKIEIINKTLPSYLRPQGYNPLGTLYAVLSDGVHSLPEDQCLQKANDICACLEFLIGGLVEHKNNMEKFKSHLKDLKK